MISERREQLRELLDTGSTEPSAVLRRVCELCVVECSMSGAAITVSSAAASGADGVEALACATDATSVLLDDVQRTVGEGPGPAVYDSGGPVLVPDLAAERYRWPGFVPDARAAGVAAVFSFPLRVGVVWAGILGLHRTSVGSLSRQQLGDALLLAETATDAVLELVGDEPLDVGQLSDLHPEVHQATGIVTVQLGVSMRDALLRIRAHAYAHHQSLDDVANEIVARDLELTIGE